MILGVVGAADEAAWSVSLAPTVYNPWLDVGLMTDQPARLVCTIQPQTGGHEVDELCYSRRWSLMAA